MRSRILVLAVAGVIGTCGLGYTAESETVTEVRQAIVEANDYTSDNLKGMPDTYSKDGALEFWSSGGLLQKVPGNAEPEAYDSFSIRAKHIEVIPLVEGKVAVAHFYSEGSMKPKGYPAVTHYLTRATQVFVKEDGKWKIRSSHWSAVTGGSGTTQASLEE